MVLKGHKKTEKSPKTDPKKTGPPEDRKGQDRDHPKTEKWRTETSLSVIHLVEIWNLEAAKRVWRLKKFVRWHFEFRVE